MCLGDVAHPDARRDDRMVLDLAECPSKRVLVPRQSRPRHPGAASSWLPQRPAGPRCAPLILPLVLIPHTASEGTGRGRQRPPAPGRQTDQPARQRVRRAHRLRPRGTHVRSRVCLQTPGTERPRYDWIWPQRFGGEEPPNGRRDHGRVSGSPVVADCSSSRVTSTRPTVHNLRPGRPPLRPGDSRGRRVSVGFGPKATHAGSKPVVLRGGHRRGPARTPFRTQSARGLLRTIPDIPDDQSRAPPRRSSTSERNHASGGGPAGRRGTVGSQRDDEQMVDAGRRHRSGRIGRRCSSMPREDTPAAGGQRGKPRPHHAVAQPLPADRLGARQARPVGVGVDTVRAVASAPGAAAGIEARPLREG